MWLNPNPSARVPVPIVPWFLLGCIAKGWSRHYEADYIRGGVQQECAEPCHCTKMGAAARFPSGTPTSDVVLLPRNVFLRRELARSCYTFPPICDNWVDVKVRQRRFQCATLRSRTHSFVESFLAHRCSIARSLRCAARSTQSPAWSVSPSICLPGREQLEEEEGGWEEMYSKI